ncbi:MAG TPA: hypothetical protein VGM99_02310 [Candidatus Cybelea sp.]
MLALSHVILHVGLCSSIARAPAAATIALHVRLTDRAGRRMVDRVYHFERGDEAESIVEFDSSFGMYRIDLATEKYRCAGSDYLFFISGHDRAITEPLYDAPAPLPRTPLILSGTAPQSFLYVQPTFVLFDKAAVSCKKPIAQPLSEDIRIENDQDAYYVWLYPNPQSAPSSQQLAMRLKTPTHQYHYVRLPVPFPVPWTGWPSSIQFNVTEDMVDGLAGEATDTLLCPKLWETSAG